MISPHCPQIAGVGLLEAISDQDILANAAAQVQRQAPSKRQVNRCGIDFAQAQRIGRLGWKANQASVASQSAGAFVGDIGITRPSTRKRPAPARNKTASGPSAAALGQAPEIDARTLSNVIFYQATLAPAARRNADDAAVQRGSALFAQAQCGSCHRPSYTTGAPPFAELSEPQSAGAQNLALHRHAAARHGPHLADVARTLPPTAA